MILDKYVLDESVRILKAFFKATQIKKDKSDLQSLKERSNII